MLCLVYSVVAGLAAPDPGGVAVQQRPLPLPGDDPPALRHSGHSHSSRLDSEMRNLSFTILFTLTLEGKTQDTSDASNPPSAQLLMRRSKWKTWAVAPTLPAAGERGGRRRCSSRWAARSGSTVSSGRQRRDQHSYSGKLNNSICI